MDTRTTELPDRHHAVQFYGSDDSLFVTVAGFLSEGLVVRQPAILIATDPHRAGILEHLASRLIDVDRAVHNGDLILLDAHDTLGAFMVNDMPDAGLFESQVGSLIEQTLRGRKRTLVRAYGEMVDILWKDGQTDAAMALELLWNKLALKHGFALLCGYAMGSFYKRSEQMQQICQLHNHVIETNVIPFDSKTRTA